MQEESSVFVLCKSMNIKRNGGGVSGANEQSDHVAPGRQAEWWRQKARSQRPCLGKECPDSGLSCSRHCRTLTVSLWLHRNTKLWSTYTEYGRLKLVQVGFTCDSWVLGCQLHLRGLLHNRTLEFRAQQGAEGLRIRWQRWNARCGNKAVKI